MRLQKYLADAGIDSRRKCEDLIAQGLVFVNGAPAELGCVVDPERDIVVYAGKRVASAQERTVLAFNKPQCVVSTMRDPEGRMTVADYFADFPERLYPVGRLDYDSEGLLIMTNDGALAYRMTHPKFTVEKTRSTIKSLTSGNLLKGSKMIVEPFNVCRNVEHANLGRSLISMAQAPHFRTIQLHSQLMGVTIFPELSFKGVLLFNSFRTVATELFLLPSYSNSCQ